MDQEQLLEQAFAIIKTWKEAGAIAGLIAVVAVLVQLSKLPKISKLIPAIIRPWVAVGLGIIGGILTSVGTGTGLMQAVLSGVLAGLASTGLFEFLKPTVPSEKAQSQAKQSVAEALKGPQAEVAAKVDTLKAQLDLAAAMPDKKSRLRRLAELVKETR